MSRNHSWLAGMSHDPHLAPNSNESPSLLGLVGALDGRRLVLDGKRLILGRDAGRCQLVLEHALLRPKS